ncbi:ARM [Nesidiocoris tenuis]|uniref:Armadillo repeat-containing protein 8 n=1 Tax=Nesidiocoris tenuis TaxID=355587 RepID=A0ABN7A9J5_9HEMI|nr:ARM [Nesidiocoris tenuis]
MVPTVQPFMDVESCRSYVDELYSSDYLKCLAAVVCLKNAVIGSNKQKGKVIDQGVVNRLMQLLQESSAPSDLRVEVAVTLGSLAKGTSEHVKQLIDVGLAPLVLNCILSSAEPKLIDVCLRCAKSIFIHPDAPIELIYSDKQIIPHLLGLAMQSIPNQICVTSILGASCKTPDNQAYLCDQGAIYTLAALLCSQHDPVLMPTLACIANMAYQNANVASIISVASFGGKSVPDLLVNLMASDRPTEMQLSSAKCLTYLHRAGALGAEDPKVLYKTLPCLVVLCKKDRPCWERIEAAETLAYLTEVNTELQRLASISNQLIPTLASMLHCSREANNNNSSVVHDPRMESRLKQAALRAFASLGANDEDIRKRIIETENFMEVVVNGLEDVDENVRVAAVRCLHSLSRSVHQLRTTFRDHSVWKPLMMLLEGASVEVLSVASSTLCNLLLEFSPAKEMILESGAIGLLCSLTHRANPALRLNGIWALMNMAFQAEQKIKMQILNILGTDQIFRLLSDSEVNVLMKTLGLLRNLLSPKAHIDHIMSLHGIEIMQAVTLILDGNHCTEVKEQALCILGNIGDGSAKEYIMNNEDILKKLQDYMSHSHVKLQIAAIFCISNLVWKEESGSAERQAKLRDIGVVKQLRQLSMTSDSALFDKVKLVMTQFSEV